MSAPDNCIGEPIDYTPEHMPAAFAAFKQAYPAYEATSPLDELRARDYARLDEQGHVYLDYTGGGLYAESQLHAHLNLLSHSVLGNPHSSNPTSLVMTRLVEQTRSSVLKFFNASPDYYAVIFTPNASGALKLVGESYPFNAGGHFLLTFDNHNSVNGIREFARAKGARFTYLPIVRPELRVETTRLSEFLELGRSGAYNLFAFPAQSNFSGVQHQLEMIDQAHDKGWDVLLDAAAFAPTNRLDLSRWQPDFVPLSFYKMFGYPTGVGCLLARKSALSKLKRPWYAGGTITISSVQGDGHYLAEGEAAFEDGTVNYLMLPAVEIGLAHLTAVGMDMIHERVMSLAGWLLASLFALHHSNGRPLVQIHGPNSLHRRGGTVTITCYDTNGKPLDDQRIEELANGSLISVRTGCFCNPGAGEVAHGLGPQQMRVFFSGEERMSFRQLRAAMQERFGKSISAVRISVGLVTNFADVYRLMSFIRGLRDKTAEEIGPAQSDFGHGWVDREST